MTTDQLLALSIICCTVALNLHLVWHVIDAKKRDHPSAGRWR